MWVELSAQTKEILKTKLSPEHPKTVSFWLVFEAKTGAFSCEQCGDNFFSNFPCHYHMWCYSGERLPTGWGSQSKASASWCGLGGAFWHILKISIN
jgi:hypothetical protein